MRPNKIERAGFDEFLLLMIEGYKYRAFVSYRHADRKWGDWLCLALETV